ncbi:MAG: hypothetical protein WC648_04295 [Candidatus Paceibacterota bacterium]|jgi:hypothetical protein
MKKFRNTIATLAVFVSMPLVTHAANQTLEDLINAAIKYLNLALALLMGFAVVMFVFYIIKYFILPHDKRSEAGQYLLWSIIGFFIILSLWGLVNILIGTFDLGQNNPNAWGDIKDLFPN